MNEFGENKQAIVPRSPGPEAAPLPRLKLPQPLESFMQRWQEKRRQSKERKGLLSDNEIAHERMSNLGYRLRNLLDNPGFRQLERQYTNRYEDGSTYTGYSAYFPAAETGYHYTLNIDRSDDGKARQVRVYCDPDQEHTTGIGDGKWAIHFHDAYLGTNKKGKGRIEFSDSEISGDHYLGEMSNFINTIGINSRKTELSLKPVNFGGHPSAWVTLSAWGEDSNKDHTAEIVGPIGKVRNVVVFGVSRAERVTEDHSADTSSNDIPITDDFEGQGLHLDFPRGEMDMVIHKSLSPENTESVNITFSGIRKYIAGMGPGGERLIGEKGREYKQFSLPRDMLNGHVVLDTFDKCVTNLEIAVSNNQKLLAQPLIPA